MKLELLWPFSRNTVSQVFGLNMNDSYANAGLRGHTSYDFDVPFGSEVIACVDGLVYSVINKDNPDPMRYRGVYQLIERDGEWYEISYGHFDEIFVKPGDFVRAGTVIGKVGNTGTVYSGNRLVSAQEKLAGSKLGSHLHGPQVRRVERVKQLNGTAIYNGYGVYRDEEGYYFQVIGYDNGFNGCIDPGPFFVEQIVYKASDGLNLEAQRNIAAGNIALGNILKQLANLLRSFGE